MANMASGSNNLDWLNMDQNVIAQEGNNNVQYTNMSN